MTPIVSGYAAVTVLLAVLILGERLVGGQIAAVIVAFGGVVLASTDVTNLHRIDRRELGGIGLAILAMIFIGVFLFWVAYYADELGWLTPIFLGRIFSTLFLLILAARGGFEGPVPRTRLLAGMVVAIATLDTVRVCTPRSTSASSAPRPRSSRLPPRPSDRADRRRRHLSPRAAGRHAMDRRRRRARGRLVDARALLLDD